MQGHVRWRNILQGHRLALGAELYLLTLALHSSKSQAGGVPVQNPSAAAALPLNRAVRLSDHPTVCLPRAVGLRVAGDSGSLSQPGVACLPSGQQKSIGLPVLLSGWQTIEECGAGLAETAIHDTHTITIITH